MTIFILILRLVFLVLFVTDIFMNRRLKQKDRTLRRSLSKTQKAMSYLYYFIVATGIFVPFDTPYLLVTIVALIFFFWYTDKEIYVSPRLMHFRGKNYEFKKIRNFSYVNKTLEFDYEGEYVKLKSPFLEEGMIQKDIVYRVEKIVTKEERKEKKIKK